MTGHSAWRFAILYAVLILIAVLQAWQNAPGLLGRGRSAFCNKVGWQLSSAPLHRYSSRGFRGAFKHRRTGPPHTTSSPDQRQLTPRHIHADASDPFTTSRIEAGKLIELGIFSGVGIDRDGSGLHADSRPGVNLARPVTWHY